jgi:hypothetical protein
VTYKMGFGLDDWIYRTFYIHIVRDHRQYRAIAILHTFQFTVARALGFSIFTSRILATDLSQSHWHFNSHTKSSWHSLIPFLSFLLNRLRLPSPELESFLGYCFILSATTLLYSRRLLIVPFYNSWAQTTQNAQPLLLRRRVYWSVA